LGHVKPVALPSSSAAITSSCCAALSLWNGPL